jgi:hypothetical protein
VRVDEGDDPRGVVCVCQRGLRSEFPGRGDDEGLSKERV